MIIHESYEEYEFRNKTRDEFVKDWYSVLSPIIKPEYGPDLVAIVTNSMDTFNDSMDAMGTITRMFLMNRLGVVVDQDLLRTKHGNALRAMKSYLSTDDYTGPTGYTHIDQVCETEKRILANASHDPVNELEVLLAIADAKDFGKMIGRATMPDLPLAA